MWYYESSRLQFGGVTGYMLYVIKSQNKWNSNLLQLLKNRYL